MERFLVTMFVCLLAFLSTCQAGDEGSQTQTTELTVQDSADTWAGLEAVLTTDSTTRPTCDPPIFAVLEKLGVLEERLANTVSTLVDTNKKLEVSEKKLAALERMVTKHTVYRGQRRVAFSAALPIEGTIGPADVLYPLVYTNVLSNIGQHYHPGTGYFTAPVRGVYYFTFTSFCWAVSSGSCGGSLYKNGNKIVSWYEYDESRPSSASNSAILELQVGDYVNVRLWHNRLISDNGNKYSSFSGFLLFSM